MIEVFLKSKSVVARIVTRIVVRIAARQLELGQVEQFSQKIVRD